MEPENVLDSIPENEEKDTYLSDQEIFTLIWTSPRRVFKYINDNRYDKYVTILLLLSGISRAFDRAAYKNLGDRMSLVGVVALCVIVGALSGWISYYLYAALISWTGKWLDGKGDTRSILRMLSHAAIPTIVVLVLLVPQIVVYGNELFKSDGDIMGEGWLSNIAFYGSIVLEICLAIITLIFCTVGVSEVQKLSIGKSILNLLLPVIVIFVPILLIVLLLQTF